MKTLRERFFERVTFGAEDECWPWTGWMGRRNYGRIEDGGKRRPAAQVAWELAHGKPFPAGMMACHRCDNPPCVNPAHIFPGTMSDNIKDAVAKGRHDPKGNAYRTHCRRGHELTPENVRMRGDGARVCIACATINNRLRYVRIDAELGEKHD
jgi:hypothetical protein